MYERAVCDAPKKGDNKVFHVFGRKRNRFSKLLQIQFGYGIIISSKSEFCVKRDTVLRKS